MNQGDWRKELKSGWLTVLLILNEIARHTVIAFGLLLGIHLLAAGVNWIAGLTGTSIVDVPVVTLPVLGAIHLKQILLTIDVVFIVRLAYEGYREIERILGHARNATE